MEWVLFSYHTILLSEVAATMHLLTGARLFVLCQQYPLDLNLSAMMQSSADNYCHLCTSMATSSYSFYIGHLLSLRDEVMSNVDKNIQNLKQMSNQTHLGNRFHILLFDGMWVNNWLCEYSSISSIISCLRASCCNTMVVTDIDLTQPGGGPSQCADHWH